VSGRSGLLFVSAPLSRPGRIRGESAATAVTLIARSFRFNARESPSPQERGQVGLLLLMRRFFLAAAFFRCPRLLWTAAYVQNLVSRCCCVPQVVVNIWELCLPRNLLEATVIPMRRLVIGYFFWIGAPMDFRLGYSRPRWNCFTTQLGLWPFAQTCPASCWCALALFVRQTEAAMPLFVVGDGTLWSVIIATDTCLAQCSARSIPRRGDLGSKRCTFGSN